MISRGFFVIADITGYTEFLTQSGLEEAHGILDHLFDRFLDAFKSPLIVSNFQGDAILAYAPDGSFSHGQTLFDLVENIYYRFVSLVDQMERSAACTCDACDNLPKLDLKLFVHHGNYALQNIRGRQELTGPDVILVHRMMKNNIREQTGLRSYALFSENALQMLGLNGELYEMQVIRGEYEHLGSVSLFVHDLRKRYEVWREQRRVFVPPDKAEVFQEQLIPGCPPSSVWEYLTLPRFIKEWMSFDAIEKVDDGTGRLGSGSTFRCLRRTGSNAYMITDWRPFEYLTIEATGQFGVPYEATYSLMRREDGTLLRVHGRILQSSAQILPSNTLQADLDAGLEKLSALIKTTREHAVGEESGV